MPSIYPDSYIIPPNPPHLHTNTLILLHGTSTSGPELAAPILSTSFTSPSSQSPTTLPALFPSCKIVFPTGVLNPTTVFNGRETHAWFDVHSFADRTIGEDSLAFRRGLKASLRYLAALIKAEVEILGTKGDGGGGKLVLGGFSQGAAMAVILLLSGELERAGVTSGFGGVIGMSGWLPLRSHIDEVIKSQLQFSGSADEELREKRKRARGFLERYLDLDHNGDRSSEVAWERDDEWFDVPILLGHGRVDEKVRFEWGLQMGEVLTKLGLGVQRKSYADLGHWWNEEEMADVADFLAKVWSEDKETLG